MTSQAKATEPAPKCLNQAQQKKLADREKSCQALDLDIQDTKSALQQCLETHCGKEWYESKEAFVGGVVGTAVLTFIVMSLVNQGK